MPLINDSKTNQDSPDSDNRIYLSLSALANGTRRRCSAQDDWQSPLRLPKPPKQPTNLAQSCPTPPHTRRRFFLSPKSLRSPFGQRARHSHDSHVPLSGLPEEGPRSAAWHSLVFNKIRSLWTAHSSVPQGLNQLTGTDLKFVGMWTVFRAFYGRVKLILIYATDYANTALKFKNNYR
ncbi:uncharacterized protein LOC119191507 [Manduca sexta]|uniref:uncharacterized protein LOC119191507 n=1 Tax=Manduca sexta TaxID=7130 RepID=UPI00188F9347|nr:uncharacterized protein LOC119191507 [Manduca sexta]